MRSGNGSTPPFVTVLLRSSQRSTKLPALLSVENCHFPFTVIQVLFRCPFPSTLDTFTRLLVSLNFTINLTHFLAV